MPLRYRSVVYLHAVVVLASCPVWMYNLLGSMLIGESLGYALESMLRETFMRRTESIEHLQGGFNRVRYDLMLAQHSAEQQRSSRGRGRTSRQGSGQFDPSMAFYSDDASSTATNSELAGFDGGMSTSPQSRQRCRAPTFPGAASSTHSEEMEDHAGGSESLSFNSRASKNSPRQERANALWRTLEDCGIEPHR